MYRTYVRYARVTKHAICKGCGDLARALDEGPRGVWFDVRADEAAWVADATDQALRRGAEPRDVAILLPSVSAIGLDGRRRHAAFTDALQLGGIPIWLEAGLLPMERAGA